MSHVDFVYMPRVSLCFLRFFREEPPAMNTVYLKNVSALPCPSRGISKVESPTNKNCPGHGLKYFIQTAINLRGCLFRLTIVYHGNAIC